MRESLSSETQKLALVWRTFGLRASRPAVFVGGYEPDDEGPTVCRFRRGDEAEVLVPLDPDGVKDGPAGWRDLFPELPVGLYVKS